MKKAILVTTVFLSALSISCGSDDDNDEVNNKPSAVILEIANRNASSSIDFIWNAATDPDGDVVTYDIKANAITLKENIERLKYTFITRDHLDLVFPITFKVIAQDQNGGFSESNEIVIEEDPIVGTWNYTQSLEDGQEVALSDCEKRGNYVFNLDNTSEDNFYKDGANSQCDLVKGVGTWTKNDDGTYSGTFADDIETYTTIFMLSEGKLIIEDTEAGKVFTDVYTKS